VRAVCDGLERSCGVSVAYGMFGIVFEARYLQGSFECLELTLALFCRDTRVRLRGQLEAYCAGVGTAMGRWKGVSWRVGGFERCWVSGFVI
jgi:L-cysteine desulfidase